MASALASNPILSFELRSRWRMGRSYLLVLVVALLLSLLAGFVYQRAVVQATTETLNSVTGVYNLPAQDFSARLSQVGRDLFVALVCSNSLLWLFLAAALAASGVARERERGLLESLQLSQMSPRSQMAARFAANGLMLLVLQAVTLPIYAVAFWMGGIAPFEVAMGLYAVGWAAMLGTALGLWFSSRSHRPTSAVFGVLGTLAFYSLIVYWNTQYSFRWGVGFGGPVSETVYFTHPTAFLYRFLSNSSLFSFNFSEQAIFLLESGLWALICIALLWNATIWVGRTLPPPMWQGKAPWLEKWTRSYQANRQAHQEAKRNASDRVQGALLADLPLDRLVHFRDPLLSREVKSRFRLRRVGFWVGLVRFSLFIFGVSIWLFGVFWLTDPQARSGLAPYGLRVLLYGGVLCLSVLAATSFTRERESGTWEGLKLSLLTPREILLAKWRSPLVSFFYYSAPLWILLPIAALFSDFGAFLTALAIVLAWLSLAVALGLWVSWRAPHSTAAMAWSAGILLVLLVVLPWVNAVAGIDTSLAQWKYGISNDPNALYSMRDAQGNYPEVLTQRYTAATGRSIATPSQNVAPYTYFYDESFESWIIEQQRQADQFVGSLWSWHPGEALNGLFAQTDRELYAPSRFGNSRPNHRFFDMGSGFLSILLPLGFSLLLLAWLRRDVRREQLNA